LNGGHQVAGIGEDEHADDHRAGRDDAEFGAGGGGLALGLPQRAHPSDIAEVHRAQVE
jgi:hypothetical protein